MQVPEEDRLRWSEEKGGRDGICHMHYLAKALVNKCHDIDQTLSWNDGVAELPLNNRPHFGSELIGNPPPEGIGEISEWHGVDYGNLGDGTYDKVTVEQLIDEWDGCAPVRPKVEETWPFINVQSIGPVPQVPCVWVIAGVRVGLVCRGSALHR